MLYDVALVPLAELCQTHLQSDATDIGESV